MADFYLFSMQMLVLYRFEQDTNLFFEKANQPINPNHFI